LPDDQPLILASSSPRRLALLRQVGVVPDRIEAPNVDETPWARELPRAFVLRLAEAKLGDVVARTAAFPGFVLAADTVVACGRRILGKAEDVAAAARFLRLLSGRRHRVYTGIAIAAPDGRRSARVAMTVVHFKRLGELELEAYLASGEWRGKAGGYAIQGRAEAFITSINGSYSNVVGLPLQASADILCGLGFDGLA
jgi:septum formation protein